MITVPLSNLKHTREIMSEASGPFSLRIVLELRIQAKTSNSIGRISPFV